MKQDIRGIQLTTAELYCRCGLVDLSEAIKEGFSFF